MKEKVSYLQVVEHYEKCFEKHGANNQGVDWPSQKDLNTRFKVMTDIMSTAKQDGKHSLLDFGCGVALLLDWIKENKLIDSVTYSGCDLSDKFINFCKTKDPLTNFFQIDAIAQPEQMPEYDYIIMNGVLTMKTSLSFDEMWEFSKNLISSTFQKAKVGLAFNLMSKQVDWERNDLFHVPLDLLANFVTKNLTRHFIIRNDYGLYEYTVYLYKEPRGH